MITVIEYIVIAAVIGAAAFGVAALVFGRGEQMAPLPARTSPSELPADALRGDDVRHLRFGLALRGYRMSDVDWALDRLADEIDRLGDDVARLSPAVPPVDLPESAESPEHAASPVPAVPADRQASPEPAVRQASAEREASTGGARG